MRGGKSKPSNVVVRFLSESSSSIASVHHNGVRYRFVKRGFDVVMSTTLLVVLSPLLGWIAAVIVRKKDGPVLYRALRAGRHGRPFEMLKFRTMIVDADRLGGPSTSDEDARLTQPGKALRRWKLDELPQLVNVFRGEMSFVGPRPQVLAEVASYTDVERRLLLMRPGITDWASVCFRAEGSILADFDDADAAYERLIRPSKSWLGLQYVDNASLRTDVMILIATVAAVFGRAAVLPEVPDDVVERLGLLARPGDGHLSLGKDSERPR